MKSVPNLAPGKRGHPKPPPPRPRKGVGKLSAPAPTPDPPGAPDAGLARVDRRGATTESVRGRARAPSGKFVKQVRAARPETPAEGRARISAHADLLPGLDGRFLPGRRFRDIIFAILSDQGGLENCSEARIQLIRRFSAAALIAETMEAKYLNGGEINIAEHALVCSTLVRTATKIGIGRRAKNITPSLADILNPPIDPTPPLPDSDPLPADPVDPATGAPISDPVELAKHEVTHDDDE